MVGDLEAAGQVEKQTVIDQATEAVAVRDQKKREHTQATSDLAAANTAFSDATGVVNALTAEEKTKRSTLLTATKNRDAAQTAADDAEASMIAITNRVTEEKKAFAKVLQLLDSVVVPKGLLTIGRSLLSSDAADPDAIAAVKRQVVALDEAADQEVTDANNRNTEAQQFLTVQLGKYNFALDAHTTVAGALKEATKDLNDKTHTRNNAITAEEVALTALDKAEIAATEAIKFRDDEVDRIATEATALAEAKRLLQTLL